MKSMQILVTGATGFIGQATVKTLCASGYKVVAAMRDSAQQLVVSAEKIALGDINSHTNWSSALAGCTVVIHLAARAHVMHERAGDPLAVYRRINTEGTLNLAHQAAKSGVKRFVMMSSIKVIGEETLRGKAFTSAEMLQPRDPYGISKYDAEMGLHQIANESGMEVVIIRPPLVYGPGVKGNFATLMRLIDCGIPLPLGAVTQNRRSFVALDNLVDLILACVSNSAAANQTFMVSDGEDLSTTDLLCRLGVAMGKPARLLPVSPALLEAAAKLLGKSDMSQRLLGNLQVDISHTSQILGWKPLITVNEGLVQAVQGLNK